MNVNRKCTMVLAALLSVIGLDAYAQQETAVSANDSLITGKCNDLLREWMHLNGGVSGQLAVYDARTKQLLAWVALEKTADDYAPAPFDKNFCSPEVYLPFKAAECLAFSHTSLEDSVDTGTGILKVDSRLTIRDHNWRLGGYGRLTYRQALLGKSRIGMYRAMMTVPDGMAYWNLATDRSRNTNAREIAVTFDGMYQAESKDAESVRYRNVREIAIGLFQEKGIQHKYAPRGVELAGAYHLANEGKEQTFTFVGCFPAEEPRYTLGVAVRRKCKHPAPSALLSDAVNALVEWLDSKAAQ